MVGVIPWYVLMVTTSILIVIIVIIIRGIPRKILANQYKEGKRRVKQVKPI